LIFQKRVRDYELGRYAVYKPHSQSAQMSFIFHAIKANTYSLFCLCMTFIIMFGYSAIYFPNVDLLGKDLIVCALIWQAVLYVFYILNFTVFDIKVFMPKQSKISDANDKETNGSDEDNPANITMGILLNVLLCEMVVFSSLCTTYIISLYECAQENSAVLCYTTWGKHPANTGIGITILRVTLSVLFSTLVTYKEVLHSDSFIYSYIETYLVAFSLLQNVFLKSKLSSYSTSCILNLRVYWFSNIPDAMFFYTLVATQFFITWLIHVNRTTTENKESSDSHEYKSSSEVSLLSLIPKAVAIIILILNFVNLFEVNIILNIIHGITALIICISCVYPSTFTPITEKEKLV